MLEAEQNRETEPGEFRTSPWPRYEEAVLGLRNYWYPALLSRDVEKKPVPLTMLGEDLVFFRQNGSPYVLEDRCAHRGVRLSMGECRFPGTVSCFYHGWTYDIATGRLLAVLTEGPDSPLVGKVSLRSYPVQERNSVLWVFIGDIDPPPLEADVPDEFLLPDAVIESRVTVRSGNWRLGAENGLDPGHASYLHRYSLWTEISRMLFQGGWRRVKPEIEADQWVGYTAEPYLVADFPRIGSWPRDRYLLPRRRPGSVPYPKVQLHLPCLLRVTHWPSPDMTHYEWYVQVDEGSYRYFQFAVTWTSSSLRRLVFRLRYRLLWKWVAHVLFNNQDAYAVESMEPFYARHDGWRRERLYVPDAALTAWRRFVQEKARGIQPGQGGKGTPQLTVKHRKGSGL